MPAIAAAPTRTTGFTIVATDNALVRVFPPPPLLCITLLAALSTVAGWSLGSQPPAANDPFASLRPCVVVTPADLQRLDAGQVIARVLPGEDREVSVFAARRLSADGVRLLAWVSAIEQLKRSPMVHAIGRFSDPPRHADLRGLPVDAAEVTAIMRCRSGDCAFKLTAAERDQLQHAGPAGLPDALRGMLVDRVNAYLRGGLGALGQYDDGHTPLSLADTSRALAGRLPCVQQNLPALARALAQDPRAVAAPPLAFFYWSKEEFRGRPVLLVTRVVAVRQQVGDRTETVVAGRQLYAAHYLNAGLNLTGVIETPGGRHYLFVLNRSSVDVLSGFFGGVVRGIVERRLRSDVTAVIEQVGRRLEGGPPRPSARPDPRY